MPMRLPQKERFVTPNSLATKYKLSSRSSSPRRTGNNSRLRDRLGPRPASRLGRLRFRLHRVRPRSRRAHGLVATVFDPMPILWPLGAWNTLTLLPATVHSSNEIARIGFPASEVRRGIVRLPAVHLKTARRSARLGPSRSAASNAPDCYLPHFGIKSCGENARVGISN